MLTRRVSKLPALFHAFALLPLTTVLALASACVVIEDDDGGNADETSGNDGNTDNSSNDNSSNDNADGSPELCEDACLNLESCGFPVDECLAFCGADACAECLASSDSCGQDCVDACAGGPGDGDGDPTGDGDGDPSGDGDGDGDVPPTECVINADCGISFECVACNLNDNEGWCEQSMACTWDEDCGFGGKCGYNVETSDYRCLPAEYCQ
jgi:hypothetical protein